jgi:hypothetical protein
VRVAAKDVAAGECVIAGLWTGTVVNAYAVGAFTQLDIVGGKNGLHQPTGAKFYNGGAPIASVLSDLCGSNESVGDAPGTLTAWRSRGKQLRVEIERLAHAVSAGQWRIGSDGKVSFAAVEGDAGALTLRDARSDYRVYESEDLAPLAGKTVDGTRIDTAIYARGSGIPSVAVYPLRTPIDRVDAQAVGGTVKSQLGARVTVELDDGTLLTDLPIFSAPGLAPTILTGVRVIVLDLADDPRNTVALAGVDGSLTEMVLAGLHGIVIRDGDKVAVNGLQDSLAGPVSSLPMMVTITVDPIIKAIGPGEPGAGHSRVKA